MGPRGICIAVVLGLGLVAWLTVDRGPRFQARARALAPVGEGDQRGRDVVSGLVGVPAGSGAAARVEFPAPPSEPDRLPAPEGGRLTVRSADEERPIAGARVTFLDTNVERLTDEEGQCLVPLHDAPFFHLRVQAEGYVHVEGRFHFAGWTPEREATVELSRAVTLTGRVLDAVSGRPVPGARLGWEQEDCQCPPGQALSDAEGRYECRELVQGDHLGLEIRAPGFAHTRREFWLPERAALSEQDILLVRGRQVAGRVEDWETGAAIAGARVNDLTTDAQGHFQGLLELDPGTEGASVLVEAEGHASVVGALELGAGRPALLRLPRLARVEGWIRGPEGLPVADVDVHLDDRGPPTAWPDEGAAGAAFGRLPRRNERTRSDADGHFALAAVPWAREVWAVARASGLRTETRIPCIPGPGSTVEVELRLSEVPPVELVVRGRIDFEPSIAWPVIVRWRTSTRSGVFRAQGDYSFLPGDAGESGAIEIEFEPVGYPARSERRSLVIPIHAVGPFVRDVRLSFPAREITGTVVSESGRPMDEAYVSAVQVLSPLESERKVRASARAGTDPNGRFSLLVPDIGAYLVRASFRGTSDKREDVLPGSSGVHLVLAERSALRVRCLEARERLPLLAGHYVALCARREGRSRFERLAAEPPDASGTQVVLAPLGRFDLLALPIHEDLQDFAPTWVRAVTGLEEASGAPLEILLERVDPLVLALPVDESEGIDGRLLLVEEELLEAVEWRDGGWRSQLPGFPWRRRPSFGAGGRAELRGLPSGAYRLRMPPGHGRIVPDRLQLGAFRARPIRLRWEAR